MTSLAHHFDLIDPSRVMISPGGSLLVPSAPPHFFLTGLDDETPSIGSAADHAGARRVLHQAWLRVMSRPATAPEIQAAQAIALHETGYGRFGFFPDSHNWGRRGPTCGRARPGRVAPWSSLQLVETLSSPTKPFAGATGFAEVTENTAITSATFVDLLTVPIEVAQGGTGILDILATASAEATLANTQVNFQLTLDGTPIGPGASNGASFTVGDDADKASISILKRVTGVTPGNHTVKLRWRVVGAEAEASIGISAAFGHGSLRVSEASIGESDADDNMTVQVLVLRFPQQSTS